VPRTDGCDYDAFVILALYHNLHPEGFPVWGYQPRQLAIVRSELDLVWEMWRDGNLEETDGKAEEIEASRARDLIGGELSEVLGYWPAPETSGGEEREGGLEEIDEESKVEMEVGEVGGSREA
jgi:hypothetical protein